MKIAEIETRAVWGLSVRTRNADEMQAATARIGRLWSDFAAQIAPHLAQGARVVGVYHRYESDAQGAFDVLAGTDALPSAAGDSLALSRIDIAAGQYLVFDAPGAMPHAVVDAWSCIWRYFADPLCLHRRAYTTDFECYSPDGVTEIFIGVRPS
jgi:predicted transcriptional regulator YdeE